MRALLLPAVMLSLSSCSFYERHDYRIASGTTRDAAKVRRIVQHIAGDLHLADRTLETHIDDHHPIANFSDPHTSIEAYTRDRDIEVILTRSDWPPPVAFRRADRLLAPALSQAFGRRFSVLPKSDAEMIVVVH